MIDSITKVSLISSGKVISGAIATIRLAMPPTTPRTRLYPALAWFYHVEYRGEAIRVARLLQPVNEGGIIGMAEIYVADAAVLSLSGGPTAALFPDPHRAAGVADRCWLAGYADPAPYASTSSLMVRREPGLLTLRLPELLPWSETRLLIVAFNRCYWTGSAASFPAVNALAPMLLAVKNAAGGVKNAGGGGVSQPAHPHHWYESLQAMSVTLIVPFSSRKDCCNFLR